MSSANFSASRDAQLAAVLATPPPRVLPREVRCTALSQAAPLSFAIFGALFGGFGLLFVWVFFPWNIARDGQLLAPDSAQASGTILAAAETRLSMNKTRVVVYAFEFRTTAGVLRHGKCYTTGRRWQPGDSVQVLYRREEPSIACPIGARLSGSPMGSMFVAIFPLVGAGLVVWVNVSRRRALRTFTHGQALESFVTDIEHTQTMVNDYPLYKITFERTEGPRSPPIILRYWKPKVVTFLQARRDNKQPVFLLGEPDRSSSFLLPETL